MSKPDETHEVRSPLEVEKAAEEERLDRSADKLAEQSSRTEEKYDEKQDIFTK